MNNILTNLLNDKNIDTGDYPNFKDLDFKIIENLPEGEYNVLPVIMEPTYIKQGTGALKIITYAPTIIEGSSGKININAYAQVLIRNSTTAIEGYLRSDSIIEGIANKVDIKASPNLELIAENVGHYNNENNYWKGIHIDAPYKNNGSILFKNGATNLNFKYDLTIKETDTQISESNNTKGFIQKVYDLFN
jgi:hypothetical protein